MQLPQHVSSRFYRISLTPLIDIVFILLIFFILESSFVRPGEVVLNTAGQSEAGRSVVRPIEIQVFQGEQLWIDGQTLDNAGLDAYLETKQFDSQTPVAVHAQDIVSVQELVQVVDVLQRHTLSRLQIMRLQE